MFQCVKYTGHFGNLFYFRLQVHLPYCQIWRHSGLEQCVCVCVCVRPCRLVITSILSLRWTFELSAEFWKRNIRNGKPISSSSNLSTVDTVSISHTSEKSCVHKFDHSFYCAFAVTIILLIIFPSHTTLFCVLLCMDYIIIHFCYPLWSSGQSSSLQIQRSRVRYPALPDFWEVVGLERGPLSLVSITEELLRRNSSGSGLENRECSLGNPLRWPRNTLYPQKLALTSPKSGDLSVGIVRLRTKATEFLFVCLFVCLFLLFFFLFLHFCASCKLCTGAFLKLTPSVIGLQSSRYYTRKRRLLNT
jgi:hypothetical protein